MKTTKFITSLVSVATSAFLLLSLGVLSASAQTATTSAGSKAQVTAARLSKVISRSDTAITARITDLGKLNDRIQSMKNVSANEKTTISNQIQTNTTGLTSLKAKIDADTDVTTAMNDEKTITGSYRIYALVVPQGYILASVDRINTIAGMLTTISGKLQTRITALQTAGKDVTALTASLTDLNAKITDAGNQATTAETGVASLVPDQRNATQLASNTAALKASRANIKTATEDLQTARQDINSIMKGLKALNKTTTATSTNQ